MSKKIYVMQALDPIHIGTGGQRLGGVDNTIIREPATNLPKIPGTSISGASRHYSARHYATQTANDANILFNLEDCAGQGKPNPNHDKECPICYTFGRTHGDVSYAGTVNIFDAQILFFPVSSMYGPVWVATPRILQDYDIEIKKEDGSDFEGDIQLDETVLLTDSVISAEQLNLGWLMFNISETKCKLCSPLYSQVDGTEKRMVDAMLKRVLLVCEESFAQIVNSNLEVRTSVAIDPKTGAAKSGALFTYEAIPRGTILTFDVIWDKYRSETASFNGHGVFGRAECVFERGLTLIETLGIGGIGTRGFGRMKRLT